MKPKVWRSRFRSGWFVFDPVRGEVDHFMTWSEALHFANGLSVALAEQP